MTATNTNEQSMAVYQMLSVYFADVSTEMLADNMIKLFAKMQTFGEADTTPLLPPVNSPEAWEGGRGITAADAKAYLAGQLDAEQHQPFLYRCADFIQTMDVLDVADARGVSTEALNQNNDLLSTILCAQAVKAVSIVMGMTDLPERVTARIAELEQQEALEQAMSALADQLLGEHPASN